MTTNTCPTCHGTGQVESEAKENPTMGSGGGKLPTDNNTTGRGSSRLEGAGDEHTSTSPSPQAGETPQPAEQGFEQELDQVESEARRSADEIITDTMELIYTDTSEAKEQQQYTDSNDVTEKADSDAPKNTSYVSFEGSEVPPNNTTGRGTKAKQNNEAANSTLEAEIRITRPDIKPDVPENGGLHSAETSTRHNKNSVDKTGDKSEQGFEQELEAILGYWPEQYPAGDPLVGKILAAHRADKEAAVRAFAERVKTAIHKHDNEILEAAGIGQYPPNWSTYDELIDAQLQGENGKL